MSDVIGRGVIEVSADSTQLKAGVDDAKRSIRSLGKDVSESMGTASAKASRSIDLYVQRLQTSAAVTGKSTREAELYKLALRGASQAQLDAADSALKLAEGYERGAALGAQLRVGFIAVAAAAGAAAVATLAGTQALIGQVANYQDLAEKIGDTAVAVSSLKTASDVSGASIDSIAAASIKLTASLSKTDDESALVAESIKALGVNFDEFKKQSPVEQLQTVARAFETFADGSEKTAVAVGLFGKSGAELLGFLKEYAADGLNAAYVTQEQAKAADDYADAQARLSSELGQFLQLAAVAAVPALSDVTNLFRQIAKDETATAVATDILKGVLGGTVVVFQTIAVVASEVGFVFLGVGREIGAIAAQLVALANLDFDGFRAISDAVSADAERARAKLDKFQAQVLAIGASPAAAPAAPVSAAANSFIARLQADSARPRLDVSGLNRDRKPKAKADNSAAQEAKAQLAADLDEIRKAQDALTSTIANGLKVTQAQRAANLVSEAQYYAAQREALIASDRVQQDAVESQIARLQREVLTGKEKIDNDRKIADAQAKLAQLRQGAATDLQVLSIRETDAMAAIQRAYQDSRVAAQAYLDVTNRARQAEVDGLGQGNKARDLTSSISQITERYEQQRQDLQRDNRNGNFNGREADYQRELDLLNEFQAKSIASYQQYYASLNAKQRDFGAGASEALNNYADESTNSFQQIQGVVGNAFGGMEDALTDFVTTGKLNFKGLIDSMLADIARLVIRQAITGPLAQTIAGFLGGGGGLQFGSGINGGAPLPDSLRGGGVASAQVNPAAAQRASERVAQAIAVPSKAALAMPVGSAGSAARPVTLNVVNNGAPVKARSSQRETNQGSVIDLVLDAVAQDIASGGKVHDATQRRFGLNGGGTTPRY